MTVAALPILTRRAQAADVVEYQLTSAPRVFSPAPGVRFAALAFNGTIPGPLLRVTYGQRVRIRYRSHVDIPTSVHWHGMILPNEMDGVAYVTQAPVLDGGEFVYEFTPNPPGTRWYHDHAFHMGIMRGLFGMFVVDDPSDPPAEREFALVFHDVPRWSSVLAAIGGLSAAPMVTVPGSPEAHEMMRSMTLQSMPMQQGMTSAHPMGDEVAYIAHCVNGASYPRTSALRVRVGDRVRLRVLNASPTQTRYVRLAGHRLLVTHADGNRLARSLEVDALRIGVGERYDVYFEVTKPGALLLQGLTGDNLVDEQAVVVCTEGAEFTAPERVSGTLDGVDYFTYEKAGGTGGSSPPSRLQSARHALTLGGGAWGSKQWTINGAVWPNTEKLFVRRGSDVTVHFTNQTEMDHPMHLHGHAFELIETNGTWLARPLRKDVSLVRANGGTTTWRFLADAPPGRWLLHCHNDIHMTGGMMSEVIYTS